MAGTPASYLSVLGEGILEECIDAANRVLRRIDDDLDESIIPVPPLRLRSRGASFNCESVGAPEAIPRSGYFVLSKCIRLLDLALRSRDFTADSEIPNVFAIWAIGASCWQRSSITTRRQGGKNRIALATSISKAL